MSASYTAKEIEQALLHVEGLCQFAYNQGFHELGYDPVRLLREALSAPQPESVIAKAPVCATPECASSGCQEAHAAARQALRRFKCVARCIYVITPQGNDGVTYYR